MVDELSFKDWLLTEIGHIRLSHEQLITLPDQRGLPQTIPVCFCDPQFELYHPTGYRNNQFGEREEYSWQEMINMNSKPGKNGKRAGIGWEGKLPFSRLYLTVAPREIFATIGLSRNLIRVPDDWFRYAFFIDSHGNCTYDAARGIFHPSDALRKSREAI